MNPPRLKLSDETIVYIRDMLALALISQTDIVQHLRGMVLEPVLKGEVEYLVPTEEYKKQYALVSAQLFDLAEKQAAEEEQQGKAFVTLSVADDEGMN